MLTTLRQNLERTTVRIHLMRIESDYLTFAIALDSANELPIRLQTLPIPFSKFSDDRSLLNIQVERFHVGENGRNAFRQRVREVSRRPTPELVSRGNVESESTNCERTRVGSGEIVEKFDCEGDSFFRSRFYGPCQYHSGTLER